MLTCESPPNDEKTVSSKSQFACLAVKRSPIKGSKYRMVDGFHNYFCIEAYRLKYNNFGCSRPGMLPIDMIFTYLAKCSVHVPFKKFYVAISLLVLLVRKFYMMYNKYMNEVDLK